jgi:hypothetical protein
MESSAKTLTKIFYKLFIGGALCASTFLGVCQVGSASADGVRNTHHSQSNQAATQKELNYKAISDDIVQMMAWMDEPQVKPAKFINMVNGRNCGTNGEDCEIVVRGYSVSEDVKHFAGLVSRDYIDNIVMTVSSSQDNIRALKVQFRKDYENKLSLSKLHSLLSNGEVYKGKFYTFTSATWMTDTEEKRVYEVDIIKNKRASNLRRKYSVGINAKAKINRDSKGKITGYGPVMVQGLSIYQTEKLVN